MIQKVILLSLTVLVGIVLIVRYWPHEEPHRPHFHAKECFRFDMYPSTHGVDGFITMADDLYYTVMWSKEAERRYAGPKIGYLVPIRWLDQYVSRVECPDGWVNHKAGRKP